MAKKVTMEALEKALHEAKADQKAYNERQDAKIDELLELCNGIKNVVLETHARYGLAGILFCPLFVLSLFVQ